MSSDRQPSKRDPSLRATFRLMHCNMIGAREQVVGNLRSSAFTVVKLRAS
jgi:hypothetical protein